MKDARMWCVRPATNTNIQDITREEITMDSCYVCGNDIPEGMTMGARTYKGRTIAYHIGCMHLAPSTLYERTELKVRRFRWRLRRAVRAAVLRVVPEWFHQWFHRTICVRLWSRKERR